MTPECEIRVKGRPLVGADLPLRPEVESFYRLSAADVRGGACQGLACFVARHLNPQRWRDACSREPRIYCLGKCYAGPSCGADDARPRFSIDAREGIVLARIANGGARSFDEYRRRGGYAAVASVLKQPPEQVLRQVEASGLRGRGGAGFPTGRKWRAAMEQKAARRHIVANADEGDAGAYIDRFILEDDPHCLIEGMAIAGYAVAASQGWVYVRCEYPAAGEILQRAVDEAREAGFLGKRILGTDFSFDICLHAGRGSYVCGEETALLNSLEGRRPVAMSRPPYATEKGLFGEPTVINNVETLANIPWIATRGGAAYHALGFSRSQGTKVVSLNSLFNQPGLYEVEFGIPVRRIVEDLGGGLKTGQLKGVMIGGPLAGVIPPHLLDTRFGFEELRGLPAAVGHGSVIAFDEHTSIPELVRHVFSFGAYESCGKCTPCRLGARRVEHLFEQALAAGPLDAGGRQEWGDIVSALELTSLCGHGGGLAEFARSVMTHYAKELEPCFG